MTTKADRKKDQRPTVLWVDDDEKERFIFEIRSIEKKLGWRVLWANTVRGAAEFLESEAVDAMILDQMICDKSTTSFGVPSLHGIASPIWSGCRLLHWLRGKEHPNRAPWPREEPGWKFLLDMEPLAGNRKVPVILASAYHNKEVLDATADASSLDDPLRLFAKPVDFERIKAFLRKVRPGDSS